MFMSKFWCGMSLMDLSNARLVQCYCSMHALSSVTAQCTPCLVLLLNGVVCLSEERVA